MMKFNKISTKIKFIGALLILLIASVIGTTIYLNHHNIKDALVINIAGKQRMLTQQIAKNVFYIYHHSSGDYTELDAACSTFIEGLNTLKFGDVAKKIAPFHSHEIAVQLSKIDTLWHQFYNDVQNFKSLETSQSQDKETLEKMSLTMKEWHSVNKNPMEGKKGCLCSVSKIVIDLNTGVFYFGAKEASEYFGINYNYLRSMLNGNDKNKTSLRYC